MENEFERQPLNEKEENEEEEKEIEEIENLLNDNLFNDKENMEEITKKTEHLSEESREKIFGGFLKKPTVRKTIETIIFLTVLFRFEQSFRVNQEMAFIPTKRPGDKEWVNKESNNIEIDVSPDGKLTLKPETPFLESPPEPKEEQETGSMPTHSPKGSTIDKPAPPGVLDTKEEKKTPTPETQEYPEPLNIPSLFIDEMGEELKRRVTTGEGEDLKTVFDELYNKWYPRKFPHLSGTTWELGENTVPYTDENGRKHLITIFVPDCPDRNQQVAWSREWAVKLYNLGVL